MKNESPLKPEECLLQESQGPELGVAMSLEGQGELPEKAGTAVFFFSFFFGDCFFLEVWLGLQVGGTWGP